MQTLDVRVRAETEFVLRAEFSQNAYTDRVQLSLHYHSNEYDAEHIERIAAYYAGALQAIASQPQQAYLSCMLMSAEEALCYSRLGRASSGRCLKRA